MFDWLPSWDQVLSQLTFIDIFNFSVFFIFTLCYAYQLSFIPVSLLKRPSYPKAKKNHRYAVMIAARNEARVIADLIHSIKVQNYPQELIDVFVIADNCTDNTADIARIAGAHVIERHDRSHVGKGYALDYGYQSITAHYDDRNYEAFFVFDADNVLDVNYFRAMNDTFDSGAMASTSYRNAKNFSSNWISASYGLMFLREAKYLNHARAVLHTSCPISGTGFYIAADVLKQTGGWKWFLLTEDIEFSCSSIIRGLRIAYTPDAVFYDEQPVTMRDAWNQRFRWAKGFYQVFANYAGGLVKGIVKNRKGYRFACYDMLMTISPVTLLTVFSVLVYVTILILGLTGTMSVGMMTVSVATSLFFCIFNFGLLMFMFGLLTIFTEWDNIRATSARKIGTLFVFPAFMLLNVPLSVCALFMKGSWKPISHTISVDVGEFSEAHVVKPQ